MRISISVGSAYYKGDNWNELVQYVEAARMLAEKVIKESKTFEGRAIQAWRLATGRLPSAREVGILQEEFDDRLKFYKINPARAAERLSVGQKPRDKKLDAGEHAAMMAITQMILNLDETITRN